MDQEIRTFVAIDIPQDVKAQIGKIITKMQLLIEPVRWVKPKNLHVTLKFLGEITPAQVEQVKACAENVSKQHSPFKLHFTGIGGFPNLKKPRVIWTGIDITPNPLQPVYQTLEDGLAAVGFERETRPFRVHLTLGRIRDPRRVQLDLDALRNLYFRTDNFTVAELIVMRSDLQRGGPVYTPQGVYPFEGAA